MKSLLIFYSLVCQNLLANENLGLPILELPQENPISKTKVELGDMLFNDKRFSTTGTISCSTCHDPEKAFTDSPLSVSRGINDLQGTRNSPTVINAAYFEKQFWDGRSADLEDQALHPFINPVEMGLKNHQPILDIVRDPNEEYGKYFKESFGISIDKITMRHVVMAIAAFERTVIMGNSRFDRWYFQQEPVLNSKEILGYKTFVGNGRCVSCHVIEHTSALFSDNKFHNIGIGINKVRAEDIEKLSQEYLLAQYKNTDVDLFVLQDPKSSELGKFAVDRNLTEIGSFKTSTLRNIAHTAPYMHDGSLKTLEDVVEHYNRGGASSDSELITPHLSGGIRPLNLTPEEKESLVAFMKTLTSKRIDK